MVELRDSTLKQKPKRLDAFVPLGTHGQVEDSDVKISRVILINSAWLSHILLILKYLWGTV